MNIVADEGIDRQIVERLRADGHHVEFIAESAPGVRDEHILAMANKQRALLLTSDKDSGELVFRQGLISSGVVLIRLAGLSQRAKTDIVSAAIADHSHELPSSFAVIAPAGVRVRRQLP